MNIQKILLMACVCVGLAACSGGLLSRDDAKGFSQQGEASFYADKFQGRLTANGERFNQRAQTAAHKRLPFGAKVRVTNIANNKSTVVRINDRGPFVSGRVIDLSKSAFRHIGNTRQGVIDVKIEVLDH
ncbi:RlpA-like protein precursor [Marinomonas gallaica]|uniref:Endolytic peptidoglycan transglycosylase RlpA n=1 Tax=Marinomonas gallaica TaxID=1806667 RepID=A0A1C3JVM1_9GAMM|nr:septal ring lytic transglycosylase RlpA family protein [Marinomonas gallaica]SBT19185.1 RlpA-like protein precursor [Marinomonas gallaica]SBT20874.1 RlpA-like protein precursor [Marinomonas gallaica]